MYCDVYMNIKYIYLMKVYNLYRKYITSEKIRFLWGLSERLIFWNRMKRNQYNIMIMIVIILFENSVVYIRKIEIRDSCILYGKIFLQYILETNVHLKTYF